MFEKTLAAKLKGIFDLDKVTYDRPSESKEQEGIFISVASARTRLIDAREITRVTGSLTIFASTEKLPFGYFAKRISQASADLTRGLFFHDFEENVGTFVNIAERRLSFVFLFDSQYDPAIGTLNEVNLSITESS